jgi:hypothetical protein
VGERKEREEGGRGPGCRGRKRREERERNVGQLGWAQGRKERWGEREKNKAIAFKFENEI